MKTRLLNFLIAPLLLCSTAADSLQAAATTSTNAIRGSELSRTNRVYGSNTFFTIVFPYPHPLYTNGTMQISADDLLSSLQQLSGWTAGGSGNGLTNNDTRAIELLSSLRVTGRVTNDNVVQFKENIGQDSGYNADLWFLSARTLDLNGTNIATSLHIIQTNVVWTSNELYSAIIAAGISANTATNISRYWATNAALTASNQLMNLLASRTNPTLYGTVTVPGVTASEVAAFDSSKGLTTVPGISPTELGFIDGLGENVQDAITSLSSRAGLLESQTITNELSAALQIVNRILSLSPGVLSNIVASGHGTPYIAVGTNGGTLSFATNLLWRGLVISNDSTGIFSIHAPAASAGSGTNNPFVFSLNTAIIPNQTARSEYTTNQSLAGSIATGASNQSAITLTKIRNTSTNTIYFSNSFTVHRVREGSNVNVFAVLPLSTLRLYAELNLSNIWDVTDFGAEYDLVPDGTTLTATTNPLTGKITWTATASSGLTNRNSLNITNVIRWGVTNIYATNDQDVIVDVSRHTRFNLFALTNCTAVLSNMYEGFDTATFIVQQGTNGGSRINYRVAGGLLHTNAAENYNGPTNANALSWLTIGPGLFSTNASLAIRTNLVPTAAMTNSLAGGSGDLEYPLDLIPDDPFVAYSTYGKLRSEWTNSEIGILIRMSDGATNGVNALNYTNDLPSLVTWAGGGSASWHQVHDQSGNGHHLTLASGNTNFAYLAISNGVPVWNGPLLGARRQNGTNYMTVGSVSYGFPNSGVWLGQHVSRTTSDTFASGGSNTRFSLRQGTSATSPFYRMNTGASLDGGTSSVGQIDVFSFKFISAGTSAAGRVDNDSWFTGSAGSTTATTPRIGDAATSANVIWSAYIVFDSEVSDGNLDILSDRLLSDAGE